MLATSDAFHQSYPAVVAGTLIMSKVSNLQAHLELDREKDGLEQSLRLEYGSLSRAELKSLPAIQAYSRYYERYAKTYHVLLQLESVVLKNKSITRADGLVQAMFMAELKNQLLTAGHDAASVRFPVTLDIATGGETFVQLNGQEQKLKPGDMIMTDADGVISSVLYGPDRRTRLAPETSRVMFAVYGVPGISAAAMEAHLKDIEAYVLLVTPEAVTDSLAVID
ncbi:MAG: phenylalanine--tRNA ligase beta subunit-related protein [Chloroflexi bacterium]|nr:phenylalanine--tRNA ligase beta subunit-related protein [Chloroflexota bacterium]